MKNDYLVPGIAAIVVALLFPSLMIFELLNLEGTSWKNVLMDSSGLGITDFVFMFMGGLSIYVFYNFKKILNEQLNYNALDVLIWVIISLNILFHFVLVLMDGLTGLSGMNIEIMGFAVTGLTIGTLMVFGVVDILIGAILLTNHQNRPRILTVLGITSILLGAFELAFPLVFIVIIIFPIYMIILATYFLRKPETIEVV